MPEITAPLAPSPASGEGWGGVLGADWDHAIHRGRKGQDPTRWIFPNSEGAIGNFCLRRKVASNGMKITWSRSSGIAGQWLGLDRVTKSPSPALPEAGREPEPICMGTLRVPYAAADVPVSRLRRVLVPKSLT